MCCNMDESIYAVGAETQATQLMAMITAPPSCNIAAQTSSHGLSSTSDELVDQDVSMSDVSSLLEPGRQPPLEYSSNLEGWVDVSQSQTQPADPHNSFSSKSSVPGAAPFRSPTDKHRPINSVVAASSGPQASKVPIQPIIPKELSISPSSTTDNQGSINAFLGDDMYSPSHTRPKSPSSAGHDSFASSVNVTYSSEIPINQLATQGGRTAPANHISSRSPQAKVDCTRTLPVATSKLHTTKTSFLEMQASRFGDTFFAVPDSQESQRLRKSEDELYTEPNAQQILEDSQSYFAYAQAQEDFGASHAEDSVRLVFSQEASDDLPSTQYSEGLSQYYTDKALRDGHVHSDTSPSHDVQVLDPHPSGATQAATQVVSLSSPHVEETQLDDPINSEHSIAITYPSERRSLVSTVRDPLRLSRLGAIPTSTRLRTGDIAETQTTTTTNGAASNSSNRKLAPSLLSTVRNQHRISRLIETGIMSAASPSTSTGMLPPKTISNPLKPAEFVPPQSRKRTYNADLEDTQPTDAQNDIETVTGPLYPALINDAVSSQNNLSASPLLQHNHRRNKRMKLEAEETVPDSEINAAEENLDTVPSSILEQDTSKASFAPLTKGEFSFSTHDFTEIVPDSLDLSQEFPQTSDDLPLAITTARAAVQHSSAEPKQCPKINDVCNEECKQQGGEYEGESLGNQATYSPPVNKGRTKTVSPELILGRHNLDRENVLTDRSFGKPNPKAIIRRHPRRVVSEAEMSDSPDELAVAPVDETEPQVSHRSSNNRAPRRPVRRRKPGSDSSQSSHASNASSPANTVTEVGDLGEDRELTLATYDDKSLDHRDSLPGPTLTPTHLYSTNKRGSPRKSKSLLTTRVHARIKTTQSIASVASTPNLERVRAGSGTPRSISNEDQHSSQSTRVWAYWKSNRCYYSGEIESLVGNGLYHVRFDDGEEADVELFHLRRDALRIGDSVSIQKAKGTVREITTVKGSTKVVVAHAKGEEEVDLALISIPVRTITTDWKDRFISAGEVYPSSPSGGHSLRRSPTKQPLLPKRVPSSGTSGFLAGTAVVLTSTSDLDTKERIQKLVTTSGGYVANDWADLYPMVGKHDKTRWIGSQKDLTYHGPKDVQRVFLLSDSDSHKPKYLRAIALGVPCLSFNWILDNKGKSIEDWLPYLLPAGNCRSLDTRISQMVDLAWGTNPKQLRDIRFSTVAAKLFDQMSILVVGENYWLPQAEPKENEQPFQCVPRIILAMGAKTVEAVISEDDALHDDLSRYDYIVLENFESFEARDGVNAVDWDWVKDCLISNRLLPLPVLHNE